MAGRDWRHFDAIAVAAHIFLDDDAVGASGSAAPVEMRMAVPASQRPSKPRPAADSPITVKSPGVSALRTA